MPEEGLSWLPREDLLSYEEIATIVRVMADMGIRKVRLTGGEPTLRQDICELIRAIGEVPGIRDLAMTTNGQTLPALAGRLADAGLHRVNVSLDTVKPKRFTELTRGGDLPRVLAGIDAARAHGMNPIRINAVVLEDENETDVLDLVEHFVPHAADTEVRFIEYMPFQVRRHRTVSSRALRERLARRFSLTPVHDVDSASGPARYWQVAGSGLRVGFISPLSEHFCAGCNRLRLMVDGHLRTCLAHDDTPSLKTLIRAGATDDDLERVIRAMVMGKPAGHDCQIGGGTLFEGVMTAIGG